MNICYWFKQAISTSDYFKLYFSLFRSPVYKTPKANISQPPVRKPLTECDSPVFLSDSDDDSLVSKSTWRSRHPPCHPSSRTKTVNILESNLEDISPSSSQSSSPFLPSFRAPTPSFPSSLFLAQPQQTHSASPRRTYSAPSKLEDSVSSEEEFLSLLDRVRKNSMLGSNTPTPKNNTGTRLTPFCQRLLAFQWSHIYTHVSRRSEWVGQV